MKKLVYLLVLVLVGYAGFQEGLKEGPKRLQETIYKAGVGVIANEDGKSLVACYRLPPETQLQETFQH